LSLTLPSHTNLSLSLFYNLFTISRSTSCKWVIASFDSTIRDFFLIILGLLGIKIFEDQTSNQPQPQNASFERNASSGGSKKIEEIMMDTPTKKGSNEGGSETRKRTGKIQEDQDLD